MLLLRRNTVAAKVVAKGVSNALLKPCRNVSPNCKFFLTANLVKEQRQGRRVNEDSLACAYQ
jgi:hypothetical protein